MKFEEIINEENNLLSEGALTDFLTGVFKGFKKTIGSNAETLLQKSINDVSKGTGKVALSSLRKNTSYQEALKITIAEASRVKYQKSFDDLVKFDKNAATNLANDVQIALEKELVERASLSKTIIDQDVKAATKNVSVTQKSVNLGRATQQDLKNATKELISNTKLQTRYNDIQRVIVGMDKLTVQQISNLLKKEAKVITGTGGSVAGGVKGTTTIFTGGKLLQISREQLSKFPGKVKRVIVNNPMTSILVGAGLSAAALYYFFSGDADGVIVTDEDGNEVKDFGSEWAPCIQDLLKNKEGQIVKGKDNQVSVLVKSTEYPEGVQFYSNGRVIDVSTRKMGSWKCKSSEVTIQEQSSEVSDNQMDSYVDTAVDDLDGYVAEYNLQSLYDILTNLKGKTNNGIDAIQQFLRYYKEDEDVNFVDDVASVGVKNLSVAAKNLKPKIIALANGAATTPTNTTNKLGIGNIEITWDGTKKDDGGKVTPTPKKSKYHDCSGKPLPHEFGCRSGQIKQVQVCLGLPEKYQTGNFGPITKDAIEKLNIDLSNGLTQGVIDTICKNSENNIGKK
jgi:hypothetical protein